MKLVYFRDTIEDDATPQYGILNDENDVICLCCGGLIERGEYEIIRYCDWVDLSSILKDEDEQLSNICQPRFNFKEN